MQADPSPAPGIIHYDYECKLTHALLQEGSHLHAGARNLQVDRVHVVLLGAGLDGGGVVRLHGGRGLAILTHSHCTGVLSLVEGGTQQTYYYSLTANKTLVLATFENKMSQNKFSQTLISFINDLKSIYLESLESVRLENRKEGRTFGMSSPA